MHADPRISPGHQWRKERLRPGTDPDSIESSISRYNGIWKLLPQDAPGCRVTVASRMISDILFTDMDVSDLHAARDEEVLDKLAHSYVNFTYIYEGEAHLESGAVLSPENIHVWFTSHPVAFHIDGRAQFVNLKIPYQRVQRLLGGMNAESTVLDVSSGGGQLLCGHMLALANVSSESRSIQESSVAEATLHLVANFVRGSKALRRRLDAKALLLQDIHDFIRAQLQNPDLAPALVAEKFGVSVRYVYKLFQESRQSMMRFVKEERLEAARRDLSDPYFAQLSITELAYKWAFSDSANFSNAFKDKFGSCPTEFRVRNQPRT